MPAPSTELANATAELRRQQEHLRAITEAAYDGVISADGEGRIIYFNPAAARIFGYSEAEAVGQLLSALMPNYRERYRDGLIPCLATGRPTVQGKTIELTGWRKNGEQFPLEASLSTWNTGESSFFSGIVRDITERRQAEDTLAKQAAELARSNAELERFAYVTSHDLQEPLRGITGCLNLLEERYGPELDQPARTLIAHSVAGSNRLRAMINGLLAYSRAGASADLEPIESAVILEQSLENLKTSMDEAGAHVTAGPLPRIWGSSIELSQVFLNLVGNAIKFRGDRAPEVFVFCERQNDAWKFSVRDNGIGIDPEFFERVFRIFQRLHGRTEYPGAGIGLAICKKIVERRGGCIWVDSEPGQGSTFCFTVPDPKEP